MPLDEQLVASYAAKLRSSGEFAKESEFELDPATRAWFAAVDLVGAEAVHAQDWWQQCKHAPGWVTNSTTAWREEMPMHFVTGRMAPWYMESVQSPDRKRGIWAVYVGPYTSNGARRVGTGQGGAVSSLFDLATGHVASAFLENPSPTAFLHVEMLKPARSVPGVWRLDVWIDRVEGKKVYVKATIGDGKGKIFDTAESLIIDIGKKTGRVTSDLRSSTKHFRTEGDVSGGRQGGVKARL
jgi:hypothetical protein